MILTELFNSSIEWDVHHNDSVSYTARAKIGDKRIAFFALRDDEDSEVWEVSFTMTDGNHFHSCGVTGTGKQFTILKFVMQAMKEFIVEKDPRVIEFTSGDLSRTAAYTAMLKRYLTGYAFKLERKDGDDLFVLTKK